jgi:hypothetical protein
VGAAASVLGAVVVAAASVLGAVTVVGAVSVLGAADVVVVGVAASALGAADVVVVEVARGAAAGVALGAGAAGVALGAGAAGVALGAGAAGVALGAAAATPGVADWPVGLGRRSFGGFAAGGTAECSIAGGRAVGVRGTGLTDGESGRAMEMPGRTEPAGGGAEGRSPAAGAGGGAEVRSWELVAVGTEVRS